MAAYSCANASRSGDSAGSISVMPERSTPAEIACAWISFAPPSSITSTTPAWTSSSAARRMRSSVPSGRTMRRRSRRARSSRSNENISGVMASGCDSRMLEASSSTSTPALNSPRAAAIFRRLVVRISPRSDSSAWSVAYVSGSTATTGMPDAVSSDSVIGSGRWPQVRRTPAGVGMSRLRADAAVPTARSARSPEATTSAPSDRMGSRVCRCPEPATYASTSRCRLSGLPTRTTPPSPSATSSTVRADSTGRSLRT